jgi:hypothetical protein
MRCARLTASCRRDLTPGASCGAFFTREKKGGRADLEPFRAVILQQPPEQCQAERKEVQSSKFKVQSPG